MDCRGWLRAVAGIVDCRPGETLAVPQYAASIQAAEPDVGWGMDIAGVFSRSFRYSLCTISWRQVRLVLSGASDGTSRTGCIAGLRTTLLELHGCLDRRDCHSSVERERRRSTDALWSVRAFGGGRNA